jgi:Probable cobalt transporter subunit (CbtA)
MSGSLCLLRHDGRPGRPSYSAHQPTGVHRSCTYPAGSESQPVNADPRRGDRQSASVLALIVTGILIITAVAAVLVGRRLAARWGTWYATSSAIAGYLLVTITAIALLPTYSEVPTDFPATVLYEFRMASLATQLSLWATIGLALGELLHRRLRRTDLQLTAPGYADQSF